jgi:putative transposase
MAQASLPLITLSEAQRTQALERFAIIRPDLEEGVSQAQVARIQKLAISTIQSWVKRYREKGLAGLANNVARSDKGKSRRLPTEAIQFIEGLALQTPPRSKEQPTGDRRVLVMKLVRGDLFACHSEVTG